MTWETFYLVCFLIGLMMSAVSLLGGMGHFGGHVHVHLPHASHLPHIPSAGHAAHLPHASHPVHSGAGHGTAQSSSTIPWWNGFSLMIFLCWFGAAGYLLTRFGGFVAGIVVALAVVCGIAGGAIVFLFLTKVLLPHDHDLRRCGRSGQGFIAHPG